MAVLIRFDTDNDAFTEGDGPAEAERIITEAAGRIRDGHSFGYLYDSNGNRVGTYTAEFERTEP